MIKKYTLSDLKKIREVEFKVDKNIEALEIKYEYDKQKGTVDLGLVNNNGQVIGWSGGARKEIKISEVYATPGYLKSEIISGNWKILFGIYEFKNGHEEFDIEITITQIPKKSRWVKGVTHMHSVHSDGNFTITELLNMGKKENLDYLIFSDHNTCSQNAEVVAINDEQILAIPAEEFTAWNSGHANFVGVERPIKDFRWLGNSHEEEKKNVFNLFEEAKKNGACIGINHPFSSCAWGYEIANYDWVEVWNSNWSEDEEKSLEWWTSELKTGKKIPIVGGTDFHRLDDRYEAFLTPLNIIYVESLSRKNILDGMKAGKSILVDGTCNLEINFSTENNIIGETSKDKKIFINLKGLPNKNKVILVTEKGEEIISKDEANVSKEFDVTGNIFAYLLIRSNELVIGLTNPIYFK